MWFRSYWARRKAARKAARVAWVANHLGMSLREAEEHLSRNPGGGTYVRSAEGPGIATSRENARLGRELGERALKRAIAQMPLHRRLLLRLPRPAPSPEPPKRMSAERRAEKRAERKGR